jgi:hypothetical protein
VVGVYVISPAGSFIVPDDARDGPSRALPDATLEVDRRLAAPLGFSTGTGSGLAVNDDCRRCEGLDDAKFGSGYVDGADTAVLGCGSSF